jgi:hypothetical protein
MKTINQQNIAQFVRRARMQNTMHVKALKLGYPSCEFDFVAQRNMYMACAREVKANPNL